MPYKSKTRLYTTTDRKEIVQEDDPRAAFLLVGEGSDLPEKLARKHGLLDFAKDVELRNGKLVPVGEDLPAEASPEPKSKK